MVSYVISTPRLGPRRWIDSDSEPFIAMNKDDEVMKHFPKTLTESETWESLRKINFHFDKNNFGLFAVEIKETKSFIGFTGFSMPTFESFFTPCVEIGWRYKESWGYGFATEAAKACLTYGFNILGFDKIVSFTSSTNLKSQKLMRRIGMSYINDFEHPGIEKESVLCRHVLYQIERNDQEYR